MKGHDTEKVEIFWSQNILQICTVYHYTLHYNELFSPLSDYKENVFLGLPGISPVVLHNSQ